MKNILSKLKNFFFKDDVSINRTFALIYAGMAAFCAYVEAYGGIVAGLFLLFLNTIEYHGLVTKPVPQTHVIVSRPDEDDEEEKGE